MSILDNKKRNLSRGMSDNYHAENHADKDSVSEVSLMHIDNITGQMAWKWQTCMEQLAWQQKNCKRMISLWKGVLVVFNSKLDFVIVRMV